MNYLQIFFFICLAVSAHAQHTLTRLWETDSISFPESVLYTKEVLYVSLLDHYPLREHGKGKIAKVGLNGKIINANWIVGLDGPKGMGSRKGKLYVADINRIIVIDIKNGNVEDSIPVPGSVSLNDLSIDDAGIIYTSDPDKGIIYRVKNSKPEIYLTELTGVNGLEAIGKEIYFVTSSNVFKCDANKKLSSLSPFQSGADGFESLGDGNFLVTVYNGFIYHLDKAGKLKLLLNSQADNVGSADLEFNAKKSIVYVPTLYHNTIIAYYFK